MYYVYVLRSRDVPKQTYVGSTSDLRRRLAEHNAGKSIHTNKSKPWELAAYLGLPEHNSAEHFEKYVKTGSGCAFANKHLLIRMGY
jgi:predicted GIY-YIG superfamily endonuclease